MQILNETSVFMAELQLSFVDWYVLRGMDFPLWFPEWLQVEEAYRFS